MRLLLKFLHSQPPHDVTITLFQYELSYQNNTLESANIKMRQYRHN